ncbi:MAG: NAD(P)/FAD-dependent oxidoreductase [Flammeovirgaceae bacterium]
MTTKSADICIIGGGIIGLASAYFLQKEGLKVIVVDKGPIEQACSHANCGLLNSSHILPLNDLKLISKAFKMLFKKDAAFYIKPQLDPQLWSWLIKFTLHAQAAKVNQSKEGRLELLRSSYALYEQFQQEENMAKNVPKGYLLAFKTAQAFENYITKNELLKRYGLEAQPLVGTELQTFEPALRDDVFGAWYQPNSMSFKSNEVMASFRKAILENGGEICDQEEIIHFNAKQNVSAIQSYSTRYEAKNYILAAGSWSPLFKRWTKLHLPIIPAKGYSITMKKPAITPKIPISLREADVVATPFENAYRLGGIMELIGYDAKIDPRRLTLLKTGATQYLKTPYTDEVYEEWCGWRPMTADGLPYIDQSPYHKNLWIATGHGMLGLSMAMGTGKLLSELLVEKETHINAKPYALNR